VVNEASDHEKRYQGAADRLRAPERLVLMEVPRVVELCLAAPGCVSVLDVGTGTGIWAEVFASRGLRAEGIEPNPELLARAVSLVTGVDFKKGSAEALPYAAAAFDLVFLGHVLHETDDPLAALNEARRVARIRVAILEWPYRDEERGPPLAHRLQPERLIALAEQAGFTTIERLALSHMELYRLTP
jgi:ubiquinone/menaquinone biosynthesis C-methylase UbiE